MGPGTLTGYIEVSKYPKQGVRTLGLEMVSYYVEVPKSSKYGGRTLGPGALSYYIEVPKSLKEGGTTLGPGTLSYYILNLDPKISDRWRHDFETWNAVLLHRGPKIS